MFMPQEVDGEYNISVRDLEQWFPIAGSRKFFTRPKNIFFPQIMPMFLWIKKLILCLADFQSVLPAFLHFLVTFYRRCQYM